MSYDILRDTLDEIAANRADVQKITFLMASGRDLSIEAEQGYELGARFLKIGKVSEPNDFGVIDISSIEAVISHKNFVGSRQIHIQ